MKTHLVSYSSPEFYRSQARLEASARRFGIQQLHGWDRDLLQQTPFYRKYSGILNQRRGNGYWLWKPHIIQHALNQLGHGDVLFYADAGLEITADLSPLVDLCLAQGGVLVFASHYDDVGNAGPNLCGQWTKRDCFVAMDCDEPAYHEARMLDASFLVFAKTDLAAALVRDWLAYCCHANLIADSPNELGLPNFPDFVDHRHDQSILSLLVARRELQLFRHPSQTGNHAKLGHLLVAGEALLHQWGSHGIFANSTYPTLLNHHRDSARRPLFPELRESLQASSSQNRAVPAQGGDAQEPDALDWALYFGQRLPGPVRHLEIGSEARGGAAFERALRFVNADARRAGDARYMCGDVRDDAEWKRLAAEKSNLVFVNARRSPAALWRDFELMQKYQILDERAFVLCWDGLSGTTISVYWRIWKQLRTRLGLGAESFNLGRANPRSAVDDYTGLIVR
jgi:hypothetical protein